MIRVVDRSANPEPQQTPNPDPKPRSRGGSGSVSLPVFLTIMCDPNGPLNTMMEANAEMKK